MNTFVPLEKRSKKEQRAYHRAQRGTWHEFSPVTRVVPSGKAYSRSRSKRDVRREEPV